MSLRWMGRLTVDGADLSDFVKVEKIQHPKA